MKHYKAGVKPGPLLLPELDGIDHINIYSKGETGLGKLLSNFACTEISTGFDGKFSSIEAYIYWLQTDSVNKETLRSLCGPDAKRFGRVLKKQKPRKISEEVLKDMVRDALLSKASNIFLQRLLIKSSLPFAHYYVFDGVVKPGPKEWEWVVQFWEDLRRQLKRKQFLKELQW